MTTICPAPECGEEVIQAQDPFGGTILLSPRIYPAGKYAAYVDRDEKWHARLYTDTRPLREYERRYSAHRCKKLDPVRQAQAANAAAGRRRAQRWVPRDRGPLAAAVGVRIPAPRTGP